MRFEATLETNGRTATGVEVPEEIVSALGAGNRPPVWVTLNGYRYRTTVVRMHGRFLFPVAAEVRTAAGVSAGDVLDVEIEHDDAPRVVEIPPVVAAALQAHPTAAAAFAKLSYTHQKEHVRAIVEAKQDATRERRIAKMLEQLGG